jgi:DNA invertase Pin-like site-specific DNA recombinase
VDQGLATEFGSIASQHEMCSAYIRSQRHRGWLELPKRYDDSGFSGGTLDRPALKRLLADIQQGLVDMVVLYKIDRLSRSLANFVRMVELFERFGVTFVCVTQTFDTRDTMGRLILNILLTFAQFEREMTSDRMRDRHKSLARSGRWIGGRIPLGYDFIGKRLVINEGEAALVREIFERFVVLGSYAKLAEELRDKGRRTKAWVTGKGGGGKVIQYTTVTNILSNKVYIGQVTHKGEAHPGLHTPIINIELWDQVQAIRERLAASRAPKSSTVQPLSGLLYDGIGREMAIRTPRTRDILRRYYGSKAPKRGGTAQPSTCRVDAAFLEDMVRTVICMLLRDRFELSGAALKRGLLDEDVEALISHGPAVARLLETLEPLRLRAAYSVLIRRIEVTRATVRIILGCDELLALLAWDGLGHLRSPIQTPATHGRVHILEFPAERVRVLRSFRMPVEARSEKGRVNRKLTALIAEARAIQEAVHTQRHLSLAEIAASLGRYQAYAARVLRINYLAPDIQTAILDGRQPSDLTPKHLLFADFPMDWAQQRALLGFPPREEPMRGDLNYERRITGVEAEPRA